MTTTRLNENASEDIESLKKQIEYLQAKNSVLEQETQVLRAEKEIWIDTNHNLTVMNEELTEQNAQLSHSNHILEEENSLLKNYNQELIKQNTIQEEQLTLKTEIGEEKDKAYQSLNQRVQLVEAKNEALVDFLIEVTDFNEDMIYFQTLSQDFSKRIQKNENLQNKIVELIQITDLQQLAVHSDNNDEIEEKSEKAESTTREILASQEFVDLTKNLENRLLSELNAKQATISKDIDTIQQSIKDIKSEHDPMYELHQQEQNKLHEQKELLENDNTKLFYNTIYKVLGAKLLAAIVLSSHMIKFEETKKDKLGKVGANVVGGIVASAPIVGNVLGGLVTLGIEEMVGAYVGNKQEKKVQNVTDSLITPEKASLAAELIARRITKSMQKSLENRKDFKNIEEEAETYAKAFYNFVKAGHLYPYQNKPIEDKVNIVIRHFANDKKAIEEAAKDEVKGVTSNVKTKKNRIQQVVNIVKHNDATLRLRTKSLSERQELDEKEFTTRQDVTSNTLEQLRVELLETRQETKELKLQHQKNGKVIEQLTNEVAGLKKEVRDSKSAGVLRHHGSFSEENKSEKIQPTPVKTVEDKTTEKKSGFVKNFLISKKSS